jgi:hypothetical protein
MLSLTIESNRVSLFQRDGRMPFLKNRCRCTYPRLPRLADTASAAQRVDIDASRFF